MVFESKGSKRAEEYEKGITSESKGTKKRLIKKISPKGSTFEVLYEEDGQTKKIFTIFGTEGKSASGTILGFGGGGGYSRTKLYSFTEEEIKKSIADSLGCNIEDLPAFEEVENPSFLSLLHENIDETVDELLSRFKGKTKIPTDDFQEAYAQIESLLEFSFEIKNSYRLIEPFRELRDDLLRDGKDSLDYNQLERAKNSKERFFRNLEAFEDIVEGRK